MLNYHFRIKSDKKKNGERVQAATHAQYIDRLGKYQSYDEAKVMFMKYGDVISGSHAIERLPKDEVLLYRSPFGSIKQDAEGIRVSQNASMETVAIALSVARNVYGENVSLSGSNLFRQKNVRAAAELDLPIQFVDEELNQDLFAAKEHKEHERREFERTGGRYVQPRIPDGNDGNGGRENFFQRGIKLRSFQDIAREGMRLPRLSQRDLDRDGGQRPVLLSADEIRDLRDRQRELSSHVRWDNAAARRGRIEKTARDIMVNIQNRLDSTFASSHVQYINRESAFKQRGGCIFKSHHLPKWAKENPQAFFAAADIFERANGERYKEIEFALPNILDLEAQREIVETFIQRHLADYYYDYAIHDKIGAMSNGERHPHVHIMFSTRKIDDCEKRCERPPERFFSRANAEHPELGGCRKAEKWTGKNRAAYLCHMREDFAEIQNKVLEKNGIHLRVDHRSLEDQRQAALAEGNTLLAELLDRVPESSVGPMALLEKDNPMVAAQKKLRQLNRERSKEISNRYLLMDAIQEGKLDENLSSLSARMKELNDAIHSLGQPARKYFRPMVKPVEESMSLMMAWKSAAVWSGDAIGKAMIDAMSEKDRELWQYLRHLAREKKQWEDFAKTLQPPSAKDASEFAAYRKVQREIEERIHELSFSVRAAARMIRPTFEALQEPSAHTMIQKQAAQYRNDSRMTKAKLEQEMKKTLALAKKAEDEMREYLSFRAEENVLTAGEARNQVYKQMLNGKPKVQKIYDEWKAMQGKVISPARALFMAKDVYTKGAYKKIRQERRNLEKRKKFLTEKEYQASLKALDAREASLDKRLSSTSAKAKLNEIATGILQRNAPIARECQEKKSALEELTVLQKNREHFFYQLTRQSASDPSGTKYRIQVSPKIPVYFTPQRNLTILAAAFSGDERCAQLVARSNPNEPDEWRYLSETEKEDLKNNTANLERY